MAVPITSTDILAVVFQSNIVTRAVITSLIAGTILTVINQWEVINAPGLIDIVKAALTYATPFCVAMVSATLAKLDHIKAQITESKKD